MPTKMIVDEWSLKLSKKDEVDRLGSIVLIKEAVARMFQSREDDARVEAGSFKLSKLCLQETEEGRIKKLEELMTLKKSYCGYYEMKMRTDMEIAGLLSRMEAAKQQLEQPLYLHEVGVSYVYTLPSPDPVCGITRGMLLLYFHFEMVALGYYILLTTRLDNHKP